MGKEGIIKMVELLEEEKILLARLMLNNWSEKDTSGLNEYQKKKYSIFWDTINQRSNFFFNAKDRRVGKTYLLNEIGLELQALGYIVYVLTPFKKQEYFAEKFILNELRDIAGIDRNKLVILADEVMIWDGLNDLLEYCKFCRIPVVGFVRYPDVKPVNYSIFEREYECKWQ